MAFPAAAQTITVVGYNSESGDADPAVVSQRIKDIDACDIWGMCEVQDDSWAAQFEAAAEAGENANFDRVLGTTGGSDRLLIIYDADRFTRVGTQIELSDINLGGNVRAPLVVHLKENSSSKEFLFMVNHLYRSKSDLRHQQASMLNQWATSQTLPVIAVGDYNFDWEVVGGDTDHDQGYDNMTASGTFTWVRPPDLVKTQLSPGFNSVLDFVFASRDAQLWAQEAKILVAPGDEPDDSKKSDHRPVRALFDLSSGDDIASPEVENGCQETLWLPSPPVRVRNNESRVNDLSQAPLVSGATPTPRSDLDAVMAKWFDSRLALPEGSGHLVNAVRQRLADRATRAWLIGPITNDTTHVRPSDNLVEGLLSGKPFEGTGYTTPMPGRSNSKAMVSVVEVATFIPSDLESIKALDRDAVSTFKLAGGDYIKRLFPIDQSYVRVDARDGSPHVFISVYYRYKIESQDGGVIGVVKRSLSDSLTFAFVLRIHEWISTDGVVMSSYYASDLNDPHQPSREFEWLSGIDYYLPVCDAAGIHGYVLVTEYGWTSRHLPNEHGAVVNDVLRNHRYFAKEAPTRRKEIDKLLQLGKYREALLLGGRPNR